MIVDASVAVKWVVEEEDGDRARALLTRIDLLSPTLIHAEVANAIWKKRRKGELRDDKALMTLPDLLASMIQTVDETPIMQRALEIATMIDHPVYDCVYLALAESVDDVLVTADRRFLRRLEAHESLQRVTPL